MPPDKVYPLDLERALRKLDTIKSHLVFAPSYGAIQQMMVDKQGSMVLTVTARSIVTAQSGANLKAVWDFTTVDIGALVIPKGIPQQGARPAGARLRHRTGPGQGVRRADRHGPRAYRRGHLHHRYSDVQKEFNAFLPDRGTLLEQDKPWWIENTDMVTKRWTSWKVS